MFADGRLGMWAAALALSLMGCDGGPSKAGSPAETPAVKTQKQEGQTMSFHDFTMKDIFGADKSLAEYRGKVALVVNVASECGFTPQYEGLEKLHEKLSSRGFAVLGFPSNDYGAQEPG